MKNTLGGQILEKLTRDQVRSDLIELLKEAREDWDNSIVVTDGTGIFRDLGFESIDAIGLGSALEDHFGAVLPFPEFMAKAREAKVGDITVKLVLDFLMENLKQSEERVA
jgi:acyl carrier protein